MATDGLQDMPSRPTSPRSFPDRDSHDRPPRRWWKIGLMVIGLFCVTAVAGVLLSAARSLRETGPKLTHTITRGDLVVGVDLRGLLESAENEEILCKVRGRSTVIWVIDSGTVVEPGDELVRLETLVIENAIAERTKYAHWSRSAAERSRARVARAELAISEYEDGRYRSQMMLMEKDLAVAESSVRTARSMLDHALQMAERGYVSEFEVEGRTIDLRQAELAVDVKKAEIGALEEFTRAMQLETLQGNFKAAKAKLAADEERAVLDASRRDQSLEELELCVIRAEKGGMVIHPSAARWRNAPEIAEGATVHKDQALLLMPDLSRMQVKVGIHESIIDRIKPGLKAKVTLPDRTLEGTVDSVASVAVPASFWTGDVVKYDTMIALPPVEGLKPGMSADVELIIDRHENVLMIPVAAVVETDQGDFCWVKTDAGPQRRSLRLGDTNDVFTVVQAGLGEGDEVVLNPSALETDAPVSRKPKRTTASDQQTQTGRGKSTGGGPDQGAEGGKGGPGGKPPGGAKPRMTGAQIIKAADKNGDGVLSIDEFGAEHRAKFPAMDANGDGEVDAAEIDAALKPKAQAKAQAKPDAKSKAQPEPQAEPEPMGPSPES